MKNASILLSSSLTSIKQFMRISKIYALGLGIISLSTGCSPGMFGSGQDKTVTSASAYRKINTACAVMNLKSSTLDVPAMRAIIDCFNENQALNKIAILVKKLPDHALQPLVDAINHHLLEGEGRNTFYELEQTHRDLSKSGVLTEGFQQIAKILKHPKFITSTIALIKAGGVTTQAEDGKWILDPDLLTAIDLLGLDEMTYESWGQNIDSGIALTGAPAVHSLAEHFKEDSGSGQSLQSIVDSLYLYLTEPHTYPCEGHSVDIKPQFIQAVLGEDTSKNQGNPFFNALNKVIGNTPPPGIDLSSHLKIQVPKLASILQATLKNQTLEPNSSLLKDLGIALNDLNGEVKCLKDSKVIPNAAMHLLREMSDQKELDADRYILRDSKLNLVALAPVCDLPKNLQTHYNTLVKTAETGVMKNMAEVLNVLYQEPGLHWKGCDGKSEPGNEYPLLAQLFVNFLGDQKFGHLMPALSEMNARNIWIDLFLVMSLPSQQDQERVQGLFKALIKPQEKLRGQSIMDVFTKAISRADSAQLFKWVSGLTELVQDSDLLLEPVFKTLRNVYYSNSAHPFLDLFQVFFTHATHDVELYNALFEMTKSGAGGTESEFIGAIESISNMAELNDGRLKDLIDTLFKLAHRFITTGVASSQITYPAIPALSAFRQHNLSSSSQWGSDNQVLGLSLKPIVAVPSDSSSFWYTEDCKNLSVLFNIADSTSADNYDKQLQYFLNCGKSGQTDKKGIPPLIKDSVLFLKAQQTDQSTSYLDLAIKNLSRVSSSLTSDDLKYLVDACVPPAGHGSMKSLFGLLNIVPLWVEGPTPPASPLDASHSALKPLYDIAGALMQRATGSIRELEAFAGNILEKKKFSELLGYVDDLLHREVDPHLPNRVNDIQDDPALDPLFTAQLKAQIRQWVEVKECEFYPNTIPNRNGLIDARVLEIIHEAKNNVTNWDLVKLTESTDTLKGPRQSWEIPDLKAVVEPVFKRLGGWHQDPKGTWTQDDSGKRVLESQFNMLKYFTLPKDAKETVERHYSPSHFLEWLYDRSIDYRLITYFYPGEDRPRVRLVNTLDMLELVLVNVDFPQKIPPFKNMALDFLAVLANAWKDVDPALWPKEIKDLAKKQEIQTLEEAVDDITDRKTLGRSIGFENLYALTYMYVGLPSLPSCNLNNRPDLKIDEQANPWLKHLLPVGFNAEEIKDFQRHLYNLWQVNSVLKENLISQKNKIKGVNDGGFKEGLAILRDMFFQLYYATPEKSRHATVTPGDPNHLNMILKQVRAGFLRQIGRQLQKFKKPKKFNDVYDPNDPHYNEWRVLNDFFATMIHSATSPETKEVLVTLFSSDPQHQLIWKVFEQVFKTIDQGTDEDRARMKQLGLYGFATLNRMEEWQPSFNAKPKPDALDLILANTSAILKNHEPFLIAQSDFFNTVFKSKLGSNLLRAIYEDTDEEKKKGLLDEIKYILSEQDGTPNISRANHLMEILKPVFEDEILRAHWTTFEERFNGLQASKEYQNLDVKKVVLPLLRFFEERPTQLNGTPRTVEEKELASRLRTRVASLLKSNDLSRFLLLAGDQKRSSPSDLSNSERFYQVLQTLSQMIGRGNQGEIKEFLKIIVQPSLSERPHSR